MSREKIIQLAEKIKRNNDMFGNFSVALYHAAQAEAFESAAIKSWIHYMDTCKRLKRSPADNEEWLCATAIRDMAKEKQNATD